MFGLKKKNMHNTLLRYERIELSKIKAAPLYLSEIDPELDRLAKSIKTCGIIQPLIVRACENGYELITGQRRYRAALLAGLKYTDALVYSGSDHYCTIISLAEKISSHMHFLDEAKMLRDAAVSGLTYKMIANATGLSESAVAEKIKISKLSDEIKKRIKAKNLTEEQVLDFINNGKPLIEKCPGQIAEPKLYNINEKRTGINIARPILYELDKLKGTGVGCKVSINETSEAVCLRIELKKSN
ncbi:MAG TPA: ParB/RepB/Spo0J family partition protein [Clostridia bacterium]|nr:ParB/RepB/Spo0J family partition protein [Clostridia bacterium]